MLCIPCKHGYGTVFDLEEMEAFSICGSKS